MDEAGTGSKDGASEDGAESSRGGQSTLPAPALIDPVRIRLWGRQRCLQDAPVCRPSHGQTAESQRPGGSKQGEPTAGSREEGAEEAVSTPAQSPGQRSADAHESDALIAARPDMQGRHLFFLQRAGRQGIVGSAMFFSIGARILQDRRPTACGIIGVGYSRGEG